MKKKYAVPHVRNLGSVAELTQTNQLSNITDVPYGTPPPNLGDNFGDTGDEPS